MTAFSIYHFCENVSNCCRVGVYPRPEREKTAGDKPLPYVTISGRSTGLPLHHLLCASFPNYLTTKSSSCMITFTGGRSPGQSAVPSLLYFVKTHNSPGLRSKMYGYDSHVSLLCALTNTTGSVHVLQSSSEKAMDTSALCQLAITLERSPERLRKLVSPSGYNRFQTSTILPLERFSRCPGALLASIRLCPISLQ